MKITDKILYKLGKSSIPPSGLTNEFYNLLEARKAKFERNQQSKMIPITDQKETVDDTNKTREWQTGNITNDEKSVMIEWNWFVSQKHFPSDDVMKKILNQTQSKPFKEHIAGYNNQYQLTPAQQEMLNTREKMQVALALTEFAHIWLDMSDPDAAPAKHYYVGTKEFDKKGDVTGVTFRVVVGSKLREMYLNEPQKFRDQVVNEYFGMVFYANSLGLDIT